MDKKDNKVIDINLFRLKKGLNTAKGKPESLQDEPKPDNDAPENVSVMMKNLLRSLNSQFALAAQKKDLPENAGMYNAHIPVTNLNLSRDAMIEIGEDFAETLRRDKPRLHHRFKQRVYDEFDKLSEDDREKALKLRFRAEAVRYTPAYKDLVGQLKAIFPTAEFKPSIVELETDALRPCLQIDAPIKDGVDLRETIEKYLVEHKKGNKPDIKPV